MKEIYILREDLYNEWAWENGATNLIVATYDINIVVDKLKTYCLWELDEDNDRIIEDVDLPLDSVIERVKTNLEKGSNIEKVSVYENMKDWGNGVDNAVFVIEKMEVKE